MHRSASPRRPTIRRLIWAPREDLKAPASRHCYRARAAYGPSERPPRKPSSTPEDARAASDQAIAAYDQTVANYRETVLTSFQQVEDNIAALRILKREAQVQDKAVVATQKYLELAKTRYTGGVTSYLEVTTAETAALTDEVTAVNILGRRMVDAVSLVQALGGGWDRSALPARPECCGKLTSELR